MKNLTKLTSLLMIAAGLAAAPLASAAPHEHHHAPAKHAQKHAPKKAVHAKKAMKKAAKKPARHQQHAPASKHHTH